MHDPDGGALESDDRHAGTVEGLAVHDVRVDDLPPAVDALPGDALAAGNSGNRRLLDLPDTAGIADAHGDGENCLRLFHEEFYLFVVHDSPCLSAIGSGGDAPKALCHTYQDKYSRVRCGKV